MPRSASTALAAAALVALLAGCHRPAEPQKEENAAKALPNLPGPVQATQAHQAETTAPAPAPAPPPAVPKAAVDPTSAEAAGQLVRRYFDLVEAGRYAEARRLFERSRPLQDYLELSDSRDWRAKVGAPGGIEGAAGSRYVEVPFELFGRHANGDPIHVMGSAVVKRVGDVPGATAEQRRWHLVDVLLGDVT